jgi:hypothetical protein
MARMWVNRRLQADSRSAASKREPQHCANLLHPFGSQASDTLAQAFLRDGNGIVEVYRASVLHPVIHIQCHRRWHVPDRGGNWRHGYSREMSNGAIASENENRSLLVRLCKSAKVNISTV